MEKLTGWLGTVFGSIGTLISLALLVIIWDAYLSINSAVFQSTERINTGLQQLQTRIIGFDESIETSRNSVQNLSSQWEENFSGINIEAALPDNVFDPLLSQADRISAQLGNWKDLIGTVEELLLILDELFQSLPGATVPDEATRKPLLTSLQSGQEHLESAVEALEELPSRLEQLKSRPQKGIVASAIQPSIDKVDQALARTLAGSEAFAIGAKRLHAGMLETRSRIKRLTFISGALGSILLIWFGAGQVCLARSSWRQLKSEPDSE